MWKWLYSLKTGITKYAFKNRLYNCAASGLTELELFTNIM